MKYLVVFTVRLADRCITKNIAVEVDADYTEERKIALAAIPYLPFCYSDNDELEQLVNEIMDKDGHFDGAVRWVFTTSAPITDQVFTILQGYN